MREGRISEDWPCTTFTARPYAHVPEGEIIKNAGFSGVSNRFPNPVKGGALFNRYLDEKRYAEELGFDGVMLTEHHANPPCATRA